MKTDFDIFIRICSDILFAFIILRFLFFLFEILLDYVKDKWKEMIRNIGLFIFIVGGIVGLLILWNHLLVIEN